METSRSQDSQSDHLALVIDYPNVDHRQQPTISDQTIKPTAMVYQAATNNIRPQPVAPNSRFGQRAATKTTNIYRQQPTTNNQGKPLQDESCAECLDAGKQQLPGSDGSSTDFVLDVVKLGVLLKKYMQGHRKAMWWDQLWFRLVSVISLLCASATPIAEIFAEDAYRPKIIVVLGAMNTLIVAFTTLMGFQTRMDKHHAACIEYTAMYDQFKVEYDICLQRENLPAEKRDQFKAFHKSCVSKCYDLASKTPPLASSLRGELERSYETTIKLEQEKEFALMKVKEGSGEMLADMQSKVKESENEMGKRMQTMYEELKTNIQQVCHDAAEANRSSSDSLMQNARHDLAETQKAMSKYMEDSKGALADMHSDIRGQVKQMGQMAHTDLADAKEQLANMYNSLCGQVEQARDDLAEAKHAMSQRMEEDSKKVSSEMERMIQKAHHDIADDIAAAKKVADQVNEDIAGLEHVLSSDLVDIVKQQQQRLQRHANNFEKAEEIMRSTRCSPSSGRIFDYGSHQMREPRESNTPVARAGEFRRKLSLSKVHDPDDQFHLAKSLSNSV